MRPGRRVWLVIVLVGCGRISYERTAPRDAALADAAFDAALPPDAGSDAASVDSGPRRDAGPPPPTPIAITELDGVGDEFDVTLSTDELELYFVSSREGSSDVFRAERASIAEAFSLPVRVAELSSDDVETDPELAPDGLSISITSFRAPSEMGDIFWATRASRASPWSLPVHDEALSSNLAECCPTISADGLSLFLSSGRPPSLGASDVFASSRASTEDPWSPPVAVPIVNTPDHEANPFLSVDGRTLSFDSDRAPSLGRRDLYRAVRASSTEPFAIPVRIDALSSSADDRDLWVSPDGARAYFVSDRGGSYTIYVAALR